MINRILVVFLGITSAIVVGFPHAGQLIAIDRHSLVSCDNISSRVFSPDRCLESKIIRPSSSVRLTDKERSLVNRFKTTLANMKVSVEDRSCESKEGTTLYGSYNNETKQLLLCQNAFTDSQAYIDTLVHESWHAVQDCLDGMENSGSIALSEKTPSFSARVLGDIPSRVLDDVRSLYPEDKQMSELEARFMEKQPEKVLTALKLCAKR